MLKVTPSVKRVLDARRHHVGDVLLAIHAAQAVEAAGRDICDAAGDDRNAEVGNVVLGLVQVVEGDLRVAAEAPR
ncbi:hypothetical protein [Roseococcus sp.]|uniref:hypothetical protein n=1 Tax=Roseococcus sp. TaxID=2109646 RepID=UPI003BA8A662